MCLLAVVGAWGVRCVGAVSCCLRSGCAVRSRTMAVGVRGSPTPLSGVSPVSYFFRWRCDLNPDCLSEELWRLVQCFSQGDPALEDLFLKACTVYGVVEAFRRLRAGARVFLVSHAVPGACAGCCL